MKEDKESQEMSKELASCSKQNGYPETGAIPLNKYYQAQDDVVVPECLDQSVEIQVHKSELKKSRFIIICDACVPIHWTLQGTFHSDLFYTIPESKFEGHASISL